MNGRIALIPKFTCKSWSGKPCDISAQVTVVVSMQNRRNMTASATETQLWLLCWHVCRAPVHIPVVRVLGGAPALDHQALGRILNKKPIGGTSRPVRSCVVLQHTTAAEYHTCVLRWPNPLPPHTPDSQSPLSHLSHQSCVHCCVVQSTVVHNVCSAFTSGNVLQHSGEGGSEGECSQQDTAEEGGVKGNAHTFDSPTSWTYCHRSSLSILSPAYLVFVVATPQHNAGMVAEAPHLVPHLMCHVV